MALLINLQDHEKAETKYKQQVQLKKSNESAGIANSEASLAELRETSRILRNSTRQLYRAFMTNPGLMSKLRYIRGAPNAGISRLENLLQEIRTIVYDRLRTTVEEEKAKQDQLSVIIAKEQKTSNEVRLLQEEVAKARRERSNEISKRNDVIRKLKEDLRQIKREAEETTKRLESRSKQKEDSDIQKFVDKETALQNEIDELKARLKQNLKNDREEEEHLRKKKFKIESEVENWIHKYDQEMEEKHGELEDISVIFNEEKAQLDEIQARFDLVQLEYDMIMEERRINAENNRVRREKYTNYRCLYRNKKSSSREWKRLPFISKPCGVDTRCEEIWPRKRRYLPYPILTRPQGQDKKGKKGGKK